VNEKLIDPGEALRFGWATLKENFVFFLQAFVVLVAAAVIPTMIVNRIMVSSGAAIGAPLQFLNLIWQAILSMGILKICLNLVDRQPARIQDLWSSLPQTLDYILVKFLFTMIVTVGLILLIVPGLIWSIQFYVAHYLVVDKHLGCVQALRGSSQVTNGRKWDLAMFAGTMLLVNLAGVIFFGVGIFVTLPITMLASVFVYRKLLAHTSLAV